MTGAGRPAAAAGAAGLFVIDVDRRLPKLVHGVGVATAVEVRRVGDRGIPVLLASSRGPRAMRPILLQLGLVEPAVFVGSQGAFTGSYDSDGVLQVLDQRPAPLAATRHVVTAATGAGLAVSWYQADVADPPRSDDRTRSTGRR